MAPITAEHRLLQLITPPCTALRHLRETPITEAATAEAVGAHPTPDPRHRDRRADRRIRPVAEVRIQDPPTPVRRLRHPPHQHRRIPAEATPSKTDIARR